MRRPADRTALPGGTQHRGPLQPDRRRACPRRPRRARGDSPPRTTEVQFDEEWAFVAKKEANCDRSDPTDDHKGDYRDHVALDAGHRLVISVVPGARTIENTEALVADTRSRTGGRLSNLMTSDDYPAYETATLHAYGETITPPPTGRPGRPKAPYRVPPAGLNYAVVTERREGGRVAEIGTRVVFGRVEAVMMALGLSKVSRAITTAFIERENGTDRHHRAVCASGLALMPWREHPS